MSKKPFIELEKHLVIGIGSGSLTLDNASKTSNDIEEWLCEYRPFADRPKNTTHFLPTTVLRELLKVERLEKDYKAAYEYGRRAKVLNAELENQLAEAERKRDVANRVNLESFNELQNTLTETKDLLSNTFDELHIKAHQLFESEKSVIAYQEINNVHCVEFTRLKLKNNRDMGGYEDLKFRFTTIQGLLHLRNNELLKCKKDFAQLDSLLHFNKDELEGIIARQAKLGYHNLIGWKTAIILFAIVIFQMFFIF